MLAHAPQSGKNEVCLVSKAEVVDQRACSTDQVCIVMRSEVFSIGAKGLVAAIHIRERLGGCRSATTTGGHDDSIAKITTAAKATTTTFSSTPTNTNSALPPGVTTGVKLDVAATAEA